MKSEVLHYKVNTFEGPLDLLLQLIEERKLGIDNIALAEVTEQFLNYIKDNNQITPIQLADFLNVAAKLLVIKSKILLPTLEMDQDSEESPEDLTNQLKELKKYREVMSTLRHLENAEQSWGREPFASEQIFFFPDPDITPEKLLITANALTDSIKELIKIPKHIVAEVISISEKIEHIQTEIQSKAETILSELIKNSKTKTEVIVTFLALLELIKQKILTVNQDEIFANIIIKKTI